MTAELHSRRTVLTTGAAVAGAAAVGAAALSACSGGSGNGDGTSTVKAGQKLGALADIPAGQTKSVKAGEADVIVTHTNQGPAAFSAICTHQGCTVRPQGAELRCPCHGSVFDAFTGAVKHGPAKRPLPRINVDVQNGQIVTT